MEEKTAMKKHYEAVPVEEELPPIGAKITFLDHLGEAATMVITGLDEEVRTNRTYFEFWLREVGSSVSSDAHTREVAEKAFEAGAAYQHEFNYVSNYNPFGKIEAPDKETYLNSLNPEGK